jgi:hypothetical protein
MIFSVDYISHQWALPFFSLDESISIRGSLGQSSSQDYGEVVQESNRPYQKGLIPKWLQYRCFPSA